ncbi:MAG: SIMPL domain-containing protein [Lachnospiraceae bacterium]|nr:SIMPL domain-containing protein [Lachnospiraceae bacterium]
MDRTIKVTGKGKISVAPDMIRLLITQTKTEKTYEVAVKASAAQKKTITDAFAKLGFKKEDLKTLSFAVDAQYEGYEAKDKSWKQRLVGYRFTHRMKLEFPKDTDLLGKALGTMTAIKGEPEFSIQYFVEDKEAVKNKLLAGAVKDSKEKAAALTKAAGVKLGEIVHINYSWDEVDISVTPVAPMMLKSGERGLCGSNAVDLDIEADDIDVEDTVTVVWEIK